MSEETCVNGVSGAVNSSEILMVANTAINIYGWKIGDDLNLKKKNPVDGKLYPHKVNGSSKIGFQDSSFILTTPGTYVIDGNVKGPIFITYEVI